MTSTQVFEEAEKKIVFIGLEKEIAEMGNQKAINIVGSGFLVKDGNKNLLVSAGHVLAQTKAIADAEQARIFFGTYKNKQNGISEYDLRDLDKDKFKIDEKNDLGIVSVGELPAGNAYKRTEIKLDNNYIEGTKCVSVGFPLVNELLSIGVGITLFVSSSIIASVKYNADRKDVDFLLTDSHVNPGSSGSPLFNEDTGEIIGIVAGTFQNNFVGPVMAENQAQTGVQVPRNIGLIRPSYYLTKLLA